LCDRENGASTPMDTEDDQQKPADTARQNGSAAEANGHAEHIDLCIEDAKTEECKGMPGHAGPC
jgi:hypothetical protein